MVMDVLVLVVFIFTVFLSMHRGFTLTVINFLRCIASLLLAFLFCSDLRDFLENSTGLGAWTKEKLQQTIGDSAAESWQDTSLYQSLPELLRGHSDSLTSSLIDSGIDRVAWIFLGIFSFLLIVIAVNLVTAILIWIFSKKYSSGFFGFLDWVLGGIMGIVAGAFAVFLFLALLLPVVSLFSADLAESLTASFHASHFAGDLYDNNFLLLLFRDFLN